MEDEKAVRHILSLLSGLPEEASYHDHTVAIISDIHAEPTEEEIEAAKMRELDRYMFANFTV